eukprot:1152901-Pelagomonas_calceolata.AAC.27
MQMHRGRQSNIFCVVFATNVWSAQAGENSIVLDRVAVFGRNPVHKACKAAFRAPCDSCLDGARLWQNLAAADVKILTGGCMCDAGHVIWRPEVQHVCQRSFQTELMLFGFFYSVCSCSCKPNGMNAAAAAAAAAAATAFTHP